MKTRCGDDDDDDVTIIRTYERVPLRGVGNRGVALLKPSCMLLPMASSYSGTCAFFLSNFLYSSSTGRWN